MGFIGAGVMFQRGDSVRGVTTASTIWLVAGIGLLVDYELWLTAILTTLTILLLLELAAVSNMVSQHRWRPPARPCSRAGENAGRGSNEER